jgi:hypothetical protein
LGENLTDVGNGKPMDATADPPPKGKDMVEALTR